MCETKRRLSPDDDAPAPAAKRHQGQDAIAASPTTTAAPIRHSKDAISRVSDEIIIRVLSYMDENALLGVSLVSKRFHAIASDSQLWRPHYYRRFILPRANRIPGFKTSSRSSSFARGAVSLPGDRGPTWKKPPPPTRWNQAQDKTVGKVDWKKQYRLRHNWARGRCAVDKVHVHEPAEKQAVVAPPEWQTLVKVVEGIAVTADSLSGLRAWDLRTRQTIAQMSLESEPTSRLRPSCIAVDDTHLCNGQVDIAVGFEDGIFGVWRLDARRNTFRLLCLHEKSFSGRPVAIAYGYPYLLTATQLGFIALYTFINPTTDNASDAGDDTDAEIRQGSVSAPDVMGEELASLPPPYLLTSLKSHSTQAPLALSIRNNGSSVVASIAYTFNTVGGWSIGIQDLDIRPSGAVTSRVASSLPTQIRTRPGDSSPSSYPLPQLSRQFGTDADDNHENSGPRRLRYSHPYLLATLPDNTLILHLCTATATTLAISPGVRLWGHTSGISDAEITPRGKAVSVSTHGDEIRLWELEGRVGGRSVQVRPRQQDSEASSSTDEEISGSSGPPTPSNAESDDGRRNWVGFDDEVVLVLKEASDGRDSLMLYDFT